MNQMLSAPIAQIHAFKTHWKLTCNMRKYTTDQFYISAGLGNIRIICYKTWSVPRISGMQIYLNPLHALQGLMKHQSSPIDERGIFEFIEDVFPKGKQVVYIQNLKLMNIGDRHQFE